MRIVMACPSYPPQAVTCGVGDYTRRLAEALVRQGERVTVIASAAWRGRDGAGGVDVVPALDAPGWWRLVAADVLHVQYTPELYRGRALARVPLAARRTSAVVVTFHTLLDGTLRARALAPWLVATASATVSASEEVTGMLRRRLPFFAGRLSEIPIGSNVDDGGAAPDPIGVRARLGLAADARMLVHFGLVYPGKGLETLLEALARLRAREPGASLVVIGDTRPADRDYRASLEARARALGVTDAVTWAGHRDAAEVSAILAAADLFVVPYDDGVSLRRGTLLAGLAAGTAIVSTRTARPSAYLRDGDNVALVPPRDAAVLAARLALLLAAPAERARLARGARKLAERCAWPVIAEEHRAVYRRVVSA